jgi:hypothetical protein
VTDATIKFNVLDNPLGTIPWEQSLGNNPKGDAMKRPILRNSAVAATIAVALSIIVGAGSAHAFTFEPGKCTAGDTCLSDGTAYGPADPTAVGCLMVGWDMTNAETNAWINNNGFNYGAAAPCNVSTDNRGDQARNRMSVSGRTAFYYELANRGGQIFTLPFNATTWNNLPAALKDNVSSLSPKLAGVPC